LSDVTAEKENIRALAAAGMAHGYYFMTNMGIDAPVAAEIKAELTLLGVVEPEVFGKEWLTLKIRESAKLRALVPRIYGLGDLSIILEKRRAEQTQALLGHLMPALRTYVPTTAHRQAVRLLGEYGIVLLTGAPATGKSMIAAILATTVLGGEGHSCFQLDGPGDLTELWNPNESGRFYWIDDAFGPSQLRNDYVDQWIAIMNKVRTAINSGNRFVLTSRQHIWRAAKTKLGIRNHPKLADESSVVNVGALSPDERAQILYNHIKSGNQASIFRNRLKPHLDAIADTTYLLPEIARRLGDRSYTSGIHSIPRDVVRFVAEPKAFLKETLNELTPPQRAALTAIFLFRSRLPAHIASDDRILVACDKFGVKIGEVIDALVQLEGSFTTKKPDGAGKIWTFAHPTIADALAEILRDRPDLLELYILGARPEELLAEVVSEGFAKVQDAIIVPESSNELLISRALEMPDDPSLNKVLFSFLASRASDEILTEVFRREPTILRRITENYWRALYSDRITLIARLHALRLLPEDIRTEIAEELESALFDRHDASFLDQENVLTLFTPSHLMAMSLKLYERLGSEVIGRIELIVDDPDLTIEPRDNFTEIEYYISSVNSAFVGVDLIADRLSEIDAALDQGVAEVAELKRKAPVQWDGDDVAPSVVSSSSSGRSLFSDIDN
jgi:hypothetical protein